MCRYVDHAHKSIIFEGILVRIVVIFMMCFLFFRFVFFSTVFDWLVCVCVCFFSTIDSSRRCFALLSFACLLGNFVLPIVCLMANVLKQQTYAQLLCEGPCSVGGLFIMQANVQMTNHHNNSRIRCLAFDQFTFKWIDIYDMYQSKCYTKSHLSTNKKWSNIDEKNAHIKRRILFFVAPSSMSSAGVFFRPSSKSFLKGTYEFMIVLHDSSSPSKFVKYCYKFTWINGEKTPFNDHVRL